MHICFSFHYFHIFVLERTYLTNLFGKLEHSHSSLPATLGNSQIPISMIGTFWNLLDTLKHLFFIARKEQLERYGVIIYNDLYFSLYSQIHRIQCIWKLNTNIKYLHFSHKYVSFYEMCRVQRKGKEMKQSWTKNYHIDNPWIEMK